MHSSLSCPYYKIPDTPSSREDRLFQLMFSVHGQRAPMEKWHGGRALWRRAAQPPTARKERERGEELGTGQHLPGHLQLDPTS